MATYIGKVKVDGTNELPIGSTLYGTCATAAATAAKVVVCANFDHLITGVTIHVKFTYSNTVANPTLNVNSTGAIAIMRYGTTRPSTSAATSWNAGAVVSFTYDGTYWQMNDWLVDGNSNTWRNITVNGTAWKGTGTGTGALNFKNGTGVTMSSSGNDLTINASLDYENTTIPDLLVYEDSILTSSWTANSGSSGGWFYTITLMDPDGGSSNNGPFQNGDERILMLPVNNATRNQFIKAGIYSVVMDDETDGTITIYIYFKPSATIKVKYLLFSERNKAHEYWTKDGAEIFLPPVPLRLEATYGSTPFVDLKKAFDAHVEVVLYDQYSTNSNYPIVKLTLVECDSSVANFLGVSYYPATNTAPYRWFRVTVTSANAWSRALLAW